MIDYWMPRWFPELQRVESASGRHRLWSVAYIPVLKSPTYWPIAAATQVVAQVVGVVPASRLVRRVEKRGGPRILPK